MIGHSLQGDLGWDSVYLLAQTRCAWLLSCEGLGRDDFDCDCLCGNDSMLAIHGMGKDRGGERYVSFVLLLANQNVSV